MAVSLVLLTSPGSTNSLQKRVMGIKEPLHGFCFYCGKVSHFGQKAVLALTADSIVFKLDKQDTKENDC